MSRIEEQLGTQVRSLFDRLFPHRQIIHRSCGAVRGLRLSPGRQTLAALAVLGVAGWCAYASAATLLPGPHPAVVASFERERATYQRWLDDLDGRTAAAHAQLEEETRRFDDVQRNIDARHAALRALVEYANGSPLPLQRSEPVAIAAMTQTAPAIQGEGDGAVRLVSFRARLDTVLGPRAASAVTPEGSVTARRDFVASVLDPEFAAQVRLVSERVETSRRYSR